MQLILNTVTQISAGSSEQTLVCVDLGLGYTTFPLSKPHLHYIVYQPQLTIDLNLPIIKQHHD